MMKKILTIAMAFVITITIGCAQKDLLKDAQNLFNKAKSSTSTSGFTETEAGNAIKEALKKGTNYSVETLSKEDGFFKNPSAKILFPPEAQKVESTLRKMGLGSECDKAILSLNRAAESAAKQAAPIFINAITKMTLKDAIGIVKGNDTSATVYLKDKTNNDLTSLFKPIIKNALDQVNATKYWESVFSTYNKIPLVDKVNPDLTDYTNKKALEALYKQISVEEKNIRTNSAARTSDLLKKVFGK